MSFEYEYDPAARVIRIKLFDVLTSQDVIEYGRRVTDELPDGITFAELVDFRGLDDINMSYEESIHFKDVFAGLKKYKGYRGTVMLVGTDFQFGMARMLSAVIGEVGTVHVVREDEEAEASVKEILTDDAQETR